MRIALHNFHNNSLRKRRTNSSICWMSIFVVGGFSFGYLPMAVCSANQFRSSLAQSTEANYWIIRTSLIRVGYCKLCNFHKPLTLDAHQILGSRALFFHFYKSTQFGFNKHFNKRITSHGFSPNPDLANGYKRNSKASIRLGKLVSSFSVSVEKTLQKCPIDERWHATLQN